MKSYIVGWLPIGTHGEEFGAGQPSTMVVLDAEPIVKNSGLVDKSGAPILRMERTGPIGFVRRCSLHA